MDSCARKTEAPSKGPSPWGCKQTLGCEQAQGEGASREEGERSEDRVSPPDLGAVQCVGTHTPPDQCCPTGCSVETPERAGAGGSQHCIALCLALLL